MRTFTSVLFALPLLALLHPLAGAQQPAASAAVRSAPVSDVSYVVEYDRSAASNGAVKVTVQFTTPGNAPVVLSVPAWTPGAYEITYFGKWVQNFAASGNDRPLQWDKVDYDTWRVHPRGATSLSVSFDFVGDSLDNAMTWQRPDFVMFNGTNLFPYFEGLGFDWPATVQVRTELDWKVATGMKERSTRVYTAPNYHDLVDMPFFVGEFDLDSARIGEQWVRPATYPAGGVDGDAHRHGSGFRQRRDAGAADRDHELGTRQPVDHRKLAKIVIRLYEIQSDFPTVHREINALQPSFDEEPEDTARLAFLDDDLASGERALRHHAAQSDKGLGRSVAEEGKILQEGRRNGHQGSETRQRTPGP